MAKNMSKTNTTAIPFKNPKGGVNVKHGTFGHKPMPMQPAAGIPKKDGF